MADIKLKKITELETWNSKELRKLKITIKNRLSGFATSSNPKKLPANHPLFELQEEACQNLLEKVLKAEKNL